MVFAYFIIASLSSIAHDFNRGKLIADFFFNIPTVKLVGYGFLFILSLYGFSTIARGFNRGKLFDDFI
jgi:hypothetical protein